MVSSQPGASERVNIREKVLECGDCEKGLSAGIGLQVNNNLIQASILCCRDKVGDSLIKGVEGVPVFIEGGDA